MKKTFFFFILFTVQTFIFSNESIKFTELRAGIKNLSSDQKIQYFEKIKNKKLEQEKGWVLSVVNFDSTTDIVYVEMDKPTKNFKEHKPDLFFIIDKKISNRLEEYQLLFFNAAIKNYDLTTGLIEVTEVYLSGIMK